MGNFFRFKWGEGGDGLETPSQATTVDGTVSEQEGFGERYSLLYDPSNPELSNPNAIPLHRKLMNAIFNKITGAIQQYQKVGVPDFITSTDNNGVAFPYTVGAVCLLNGIEYRSLVANNTTTPPSSSWEKVAPSVLDSTNTLISSPSVAKNAFFTGVTTGKYLSVKIEGLATATASSILDFGGMVIKILQDDRDDNGVTIPDSWVVFIKGDMKNGVWVNAQALNLTTSASVTLLVNFTRTATDAFIEFDFTTIGTSYMSVIVQDISTYVIGSYSPQISITMQSSKLGTLSTDFTRSVIGSQPLNSILTGIALRNVPVLNRAEYQTQNAMGTAVTFTGIPSWAKRLTFLYNQISGSSTGSKFLRIGTGGALESTGYRAGNGNINGSNTCNNLLISTGFNINNGGDTSTNKDSGKMVLDLFDSNTWILSGTMVMHAATVVGYQAGIKTLGGTLDTVGFVIDAGTFTAGSVKLIVEG